MTTVILEAMSFFAAIYLTPLDRYNPLFNRRYYIVPLTISVVFIASTYLNFNENQKNMFTKKNICITSKCVVKKALLIEGELFV
jgi:hypothetical protein